MKNLCVFAFLLLPGCGTVPGILLEQTPIANHPEWQPAGDTLVRNFSIDLGMDNEREVPMRLTLLPALDTLGLTRAGYVRLERLPGGPGGIRMKAGDYVIAEEGPPSWFMASLSVEGFAWALWAPWPFDHYNSLIIDPEGNIIGYPDPDNPVQ
jgi:hypothetical protein